MYTLDTNAIIYYLGVGEAALTRMVDELLDGSTPLYVSTITVLELHSGPGLSTREREAISGLLDTFFIVPVDFELACEAGRLRSLYAVKTPDAAIAATALCTDTMLMTRNIRDFRRIEELSVRKI